MKKIIFISLILTLIMACFSISFAGTFKDLIDTKYEGIAECLSFLKIVDGVGDNIYDANKIVTRAEIAKMLVLAHGYEENSELLNAPAIFKDVKTGDWYYDYVNIAAAYGLIKGYPDGNFYPDKEVTYAEAVAMIMRSLGHNYIREDSEYGWEFNYIQKMRDIKLNEGMEVFENSNGAKRGEVAILIWNMLNQNTWEIIEEEGTGILTYVDSGKVLLDKVFGKEYQLVSGKKIRSFSAFEKTMYANVESLGEVKLNDLLPIYALGSKVTGVFNKKEKILSCATYDMDLTIVEGTAKEMEAEGYKLKSVKDKYYLGGREEDYIFYAVKREGADETIDRAIVLDLNNKIFIEERKTVKNILTLNENIDIDMDEAIILDGKKAYEWSKVGEDDSILSIGDNVYLLVNKYKTEDDVKDEERERAKNDTLYYISSVSYSNENAYINLTSSEGSKHYQCTTDLNNFPAGSLVLVTVENNKVTRLTYATSNEYDDLKLGKQLILRYGDKSYLPGMLGKYIIDKNTQIYVANKKYQNNSNEIIQKCTLEAIDESELKYLDEEVVHIIADGNVAKVIYVERETNKFSVFYGIVRDVIQEKEKIKLTVSPIDSALKVCEPFGKVECEIGDIISYTLSGKEGEEILRTDEIYHAGVIGYKGDLVVGSVTGKDVTLINGEHFNQTSNIISVNGKNYKLNNYIIISAKVRQSDGEWRFSSATFAEMKTMKFAPGDRIAIDELEGTMVIYSGYTM